MFPIIPKVPMLGKLAAKKKLEFANAARAGSQSDSAPASRSGFTSRSRRPQPEPYHTCAPTDNNDFRIQQLKHGGPVQRALRADLSLLKLGFEKDVEEFYTDGGGDGGQSQRQSLSQSKLDREKNAKLKAGKMFTIFKSTFQRTRFGIIHTRCCPHRSDPDAYIQLIYSSVLDLLHVALRDCDEVGLLDSRGQSGGGDSHDALDDDDELVHDNESEGDNDSGDEVGKKFSFLINAVFHIFALYTLYETNPYPDICKQLASANEHDNKQKEEQEEDDQERVKRCMLSFLPLGTSIEHLGRKTHRRCYRSCIRIDPMDFALISRLRDLSFAYMDFCDQRSLEFDTSVEVLGRHDSCAFTRGFPTNLDRENDEGARNAGIRSKLNAMYGLAADCIHVIDRLQTLFQFSEYSGPASLEGLAGSAQYYHTIALKGEKHHCERKSMSEGLDLEHVLEEVDASYPSTRSEDDEDGLCRVLDLAEFESSLQSRQERYSTILRNVGAELARNRSTRNPSRQMMAIQEMLQPTLDHRRMAVDHDHGKSNGHVILSDRLRLSLVGRQPVRNISTTGTGTEEEISEVRNNESITIAAKGASSLIPLAYPNSFSSGLQLGIQKALTSLLKIKKKKASQLKRGNMRPVSDAKSVDHDSWFFEDDFLEDDDDESVPCGNVQDEEIDTDPGDHFTINSEEDEMEGLGALQELISFANEKNKKKKMKGGEKQRADKASKYIPSDSHESDESESDESIDSEAGNRALQTLLTAVTTKAPKKRKRGVKKAAESMPFDNNSVISIQTGPGESALQALLERANPPPAKKKRTAAQRGKKVMRQGVKIALQKVPHQKGQNTSNVSSTTSKPNTRSRKMVDDLSMQSNHSFSTNGVHNAIESGQYALQSLLSKAGITHEEGQYKGDAGESHDGRKNDDSDRASNCSESIQASAKDSLATVGLDNKLDRRGAKPVAPLKRQNTSKASATKKKPNTRSRRKKNVDEISIQSNHSLSTNGAHNVIEPGQQAPQSLLSNRGKGEQQNEDSGESHDGQIDDSDHASHCSESIMTSAQGSLATAGPGKNALDKLFSQVKKKSK